MVLASRKLVLSACFCRVSHEVVLACLKLVFSVCCCRISPEVVLVLATLKLVLSVCCCRVSHEVVLACFKCVLSGLFPCFSWSTTDVLMHVLYICHYITSWACSAEFRMRWFWHVFKLVLLGSLIGMLHSRWYGRIWSLFCLCHCQVWHEVALARLKLVLSAPLPSMTWGGTGMSYFFIFCHGYCRASREVVLTCLYSVMVIAELHMRWYCRASREVVLTSLYSVMVIAELHVRWFWHVFILSWLLPSFTWGGTDMSLFCHGYCRASHEVVLTCLKLVLAVCTIAELHTRWYWRVLSLFCLRHCRMWH